MTQENTTAPPPKTPLAFMKFYGSDFINSTASWSMEERGIYLTLLWYAWVNNGLPGDIDRIDRMAPGAKAAWGVVGDKFPTSPDGKRRNPRQERDREAMLVQWQQWSERGQAGAAKRWGKNASSMQQALPEHSSSNSNQISDVRYQMVEKEKTLTRVACEPVYVHKPNAIQANRSVEVRASVSERRRAAIPHDAIERVWQRFPRKVGKLKALALIPGAIRRIMEEWDHETPEDAIIYLMERIDALTKKHKAGDPKFIPHPATWLNQGRYLDPEDQQ